MNLPRRPSSLVLSLLPLVLGCATVSFKPESTSGFVLRETAGHRHYVYLPAHWQSGERLPVIVWLHGGGERGQDPIEPTQVMLGRVAWESRGQLPFLVVFPQCDSGKFWALPEMEARVFAALDDAVATYRGDPDRVILAGHSMGGYGTWILGSRHPDRFAALVPISGGIKPPGGIRLPAGAKVAADPEGEAIAAIGRLPVWIFHGASDWLVPVELGRRLAQRLDFAGGDVRYTEYPEIGHGADDRAFREAELFPWLAQQRRRPRSGATDSPPATLNSPTKNP